MYCQFLKFAGPAILILATPAEASVRNYFSPAWNGTRIDSCLGTGTGCGKPAADAFCKAEGYDKALLFQREVVEISLSIGSDELCTSGSCTAFRQIKCYSVKGDFAGLQ